MKKYLLGIFLSFAYIHAALDISTVSCDFDERGLPVFRNHTHELNWWLDKEKPKRFIITNNSDDDVTIKLIVQSHYPQPSWGIVPEFATQLNGYQFLLTSGSDGDGTIQIDAEIAKIKFSPHYKGCHKVSIFQTREITLNAGEQQEHNLEYNYGLRCVQLKGSKNFINFSVVENTIELNVSLNAKPAATSLADFILRTNFLDESGKEFYETDINYFGAYQRTLEYFYQEAGLTREDVKAKRRVLVEKAKDIIRHIGDPSYVLEQGIPRILHRIWYTSDETPQEIARKRLDHLLEQAQKYNDFQHILWVKDKTKIPLTVQSITESGVPIAIRELSEIWPEIRGKQVIKRLYDAGKIVAITDILRYNLIYILGGIYADLGVHFEIDPKILTNHFTSFSLREGWVYGGGALAGIKAHLVYNDILDYIENIDRTPAILRKCITDLGVPFTALAMLTAKFDTADESPLKHLNILWNKGIITVNNTGSWLTGKKFPQDMLFGDDIFGEGYDWDTDHEEWLTPSIAIAKHLMEKTKQDLQKGRAAIFKKCCDIYHGNTAKKFTIPHISHRTWVTSNVLPKEAPEEQLNNYLRSIQMLNAGNSDWQHVFWCLNKKQIPKTIQYLERSGLSIEIREITSIFSKMKGFHIFKALYEDNRFTNANDILRQNILNIFGGLYADLGVLFERNITPILDTYNYIFCLREWKGAIDTNVFAAAPSSFLISRFLNITDNLDSIPEPLKQLFDSEDKRLYMLGTPMLMAIVDLCTPENESIFFLHETGMMSNKNLRSWLQGSFGNTPITASTINIFETPKTTHYILDQCQSDIRKVFEPAGGYKVTSEYWFVKYTIPIAECMYQKTLSELSLTRQRLMQTSYTTFTSSEKIYKIPHITHRSWLTNPDNPFETPVDKLDAYFSALRQLKTGDWTHYFWCLDPTKIPETIQKIQAQTDLHIEIHKIDEIYPKMQGKHIFEAMLKDKRFTNANDISRLNILYLFGGLYSDIGMFYNLDLTDLIDSYEYFWWLNIFNNIDHTLCATPKGNTILEKHLAVIDTLYNLPIEIQAITPTPYSQMVWTGSHHLMALIDSTCTGNERMLFIKDKGLVTLNNLASWGAQPKFGNTGVLESKLNVFEIRPILHD